MPPKYRRIGDFYRYYAGYRKAPYLTLFVGGNHEASNHLLELYYGGWVAPNIYYLGAANVIRVGPLRIAGMSGIWKGYDYRKPHHERLPFSRDDVKSIYHVREIDTRKLLQFRSQVDVGISHDWPRGVEWKGDYRTLFKKKRGFEEDAQAGNLGNVAAQQVLDRLRPKLWLSAHLHVKYSAVIGHKKSQNEKGKGIGLNVPERQKASTNDGLPAVKNEDEIDLDLDDEASDKQNTVHDTPPTDMPDQLKADEAETEDGKLQSEPLIDQLKETNKVPESLRAQLPSSFTKPENNKRASAVDTHQSLPFPEGIKNDTTYFLALDKVGPSKHFLQLMPTKSLNTAPLDQQRGHVKLQYDKEWLAITRVFAKDIVIGRNSSNSSDNTIDSSTAMIATPAADQQRGTVPPNLGEAHYRPLIEAEEAWVEENIVQRGLLDVPQNFKITAPVYDRKRGEHVPEPPREYVNPQTSAFCELLGIRNPVAATEEEIQERMGMGMSEEMMENAGSNLGDGGGHHRHQYYNHHRGGRGGRGGSRGGGRGRRGRGRY